MLFIIFFLPAPAAVFSQSVPGGNNPFSGSSQFSYNYNSLSNDPQQLPPAYFLWDGNQHFGYGGLPFEMYWNITSANSYDRLIPNAFSVKFDVEKFRNGLRQRAEQQIKSESLGILQKKTKRDEIKNEREAIKSFFENPQVKEQIAMISRHDSLNNFLARNKEKLSDFEIQNLKNEIESIQEASANKNAFSELKEKSIEFDIL